MLAIITTTIILCQQNTGPNLGIVGTLWNTPWMFHHHPWLYLKQHSLWETGRPTPWGSWWHRDQLKMQLTWFCITEAVPARREFSQGLRSTRPLLQKDYGGLFIELSRPPCPGSRYTHSHKHSCTHTHCHIHIHSYTRIYIHTLTYTSIHTVTLMHRHSYTLLYTLRHIHTHTYTLTHTHAHIYTLSHILSVSLCLCLSVCLSLSLSHTHTHSLLGEVSSCSPYVADLRFTDICLILTSCPAIVFYS